MSLVVSDSGPIHYLVLCEAIDVIPKLYGRLVIPDLVIHELTHPNTPLAVSQWVQTLPEWASAQRPARLEHLPQLGVGERAAIALAIELKATQLLVDDRVARKVATQHGILTTGTVGILEQAAVNNLIALSDTMQKLLKTNFRIDSAVVREVLARDGVRRKSVDPAK